MFYLFLFGQNLGLLAKSNNTINWKELLLFSPLDMQSWGELKVIFKAPSTLVDIELFQSIIFRGEHDRLCQFQFVHAQQGWLAAPFYSPFSQNLFLLVRLFMGCYAFTTVD